MFVSKVTKRIERRRLLYILLFGPILLFTLANNVSANEPVFDCQAPHHNSDTSSLSQPENTAPTVSIVRVSGNDCWTINPFISGFSLLEQKTSVTYGLDEDRDGIANFPTLPVRGAVIIPVFLVDWSDFDPAIDESNHNNPNSVYHGYQKKSPTELSTFLNGPHGPASYFREVSGGQLSITFEVFPWMVSDNMTYLSDKEPNYYFYDSQLEEWCVKKREYALDVLRSAVVDLGVNLSDYDADNNAVLDGFVIVYEGQAGKLAGENLSWTNYAYNVKTERPYLHNVASLVDSTDPNFETFAAQPILFSRYNNISEQWGPNDPGKFTHVGTWVHEIGHLLLGYRDYYHKPNDLGDYAFSAHSGDPNPYHPAAMEKWLFVHWIEPVTVETSGTFTLTNHHLTKSQTYDPHSTYLYKVPIEGDPLHFLTIENRYYLPENRGGSRFNEKQPGSSPESGLVIFEINRHTSTSQQIRRLIPERVQELPHQSRGAFQSGDLFVYSSENFHLKVSDVSVPDEQVSFTLEVSNVY
ncbi:MAG: hypothetical protein D8M57_10210 [Candidatus Scalindua sp. AMX11]|nr:MAG: hypothetical protein DWQ00_01345 [Candidatus Scalindua sp.]TDE64963.1 MAG: hypothetical protein D8M57_10210 [Candidatus Scalindua sp. AMX11]